MEAPLTAKAAILQALISEAGYGLEIVERVRERTKGKIKLHQGSVYPALRALERDGFLRSWESDPLPERGGRPRRYYELTAEGLREARELREGLLGLFMEPKEVPA